MIYLGYMMNPNVDYKEKKSICASTPFSYLFLVLRIEPWALSMRGECATTEPGPQTPGQLRACWVGIKQEWL